MYIWYWKWQTKRKITKLDSSINYANVKLNTLNIHIARMDRGHRLYGHCLLLVSSLERVIDELSAQRKSLAFILGALTELGKIKKSSKKDFDSHVEAFCSGLGLLCQIEAESRRLIK